MSGVLVVCTLLMSIPDAPAHWVVQEQISIRRGCFQLSAESETPAKELRDYEVSIELDRDEYLSGETILLHWKIENKGLLPLPIDLGGDYFSPHKRPYRFKVRAIRDDGHVANDPFGPPGFIAMSSLSYGGHLKTGESYYESLHLQSFAKLTPGRWNIEVYHDLGWTGAESPRKLHLLTWDDSYPDYVRAPIATTTITIRRPHPALARSVVETTLSRPSQPALSFRKRQPQRQVFDDFDDPVYLPVMLELIASGDLRGRESLNAMKSSEVMPLLKEMLSHPDLKIRETAQWEYDKRIAGNPSDNR